MSPRLASILFALTFAWAASRQAQAAPADLWLTNGRVRTVAVSGTTAYIGGDFTQLVPRLGAFVPVDPQTGAARQGFPKVVGIVYAAVADGSGGWYIGGGFQTVGGLPRRGLAHVLSDLTVSDWNPSPTNEVYAMALAGSTLYVGGAFEAIDGGAPRHHVAAYSTTDDVLTPWNPDANNYVWTIVPNDSTVYLGGDFTVVNGRPRNHAAEVSAIDAQPTGWRPNPDARVRTIVRDDSTLYLGGDFSMLGGASRKRIGAVDAGLGIATSWNPSPNFAVISLQVRGSTLFVGGNFFTIAGQTRQYFAAFDLATGSLLPMDPGFDGTIGSLTLDGARLYANGAFRHVAGQTRQGVALLDADSGALSSWNPKPHGTVNVVVPQHIVPIGVPPSVYLGGGFATFDDLIVPRQHLAALDLPTGAVTGWNPGANDTVYALAARGDTIYAGGTFTSAGGQPRTALVQIVGPAGAATVWQPDPDRSVRTMAWSGPLLYVGGAFTSVAGEPRSRLAAIDGSGIPTPWSPNADGLVRTLAVSRGVVYAGGDFVTVGGLVRTKIAAIDSTTGVPTSWNPGNPNQAGSVSSIATSDEIIYVGGSFTVMGDRFRNNAAALQRTSGFPTAFDPNVLAGPVNVAMINCLLPVGSHVYAGGSFGRAGLQVRLSLASLDTLLGAASPWAPNPMIGVDLQFPIGPATIEAMAQGPGVLVVGGQFDFIDNRYQSGVAQVDLDTEPPSYRVISTEATGDYIRVVWAVPAGVGVNVERKQAGGGWQRVQFVTSDGHVEYQDPQVVPGRQYDYRLEFDSDGATLTFGEVTVAMPPLTVAFQGLQQNPAVDEVRIAFTLSDASPATIELFDLGGRRVFKRELTGYGPGRHVVGLFGARAVRPGVYLLRFTNGGHTFHTRGVVLR